MASFTIEWKPSAVKDLRGLPRDVVARIIAAVEGLVQNPFPSSSKKLVGSKHTYRIRIGDYRVVYNVLTAEVVVEVLRVAHRRDVYR
jgi:mRNA interferase RelE/StbE